MVMPYIIDGVSTVIPAVYTSFFVQNSLPSPAPAGRSVFIFGEAEEGVPGADLDLRLNFFQTFESVREHYKSGQIVNAARMLLGGRQPGQNGSIDRVYIYKTNSSLRASRNLADASYGALVAGRFGEPGNLIRTQVVESRAETKPSKTFKYLSSPAARGLNISVNGIKTEINLPANARASDLKAEIQMSAAGALVDVDGGFGADIFDSEIVVDVSVDGEGDILVISSAASAMQTGQVNVGDVLYISPTSALSVYQGNYIVLSANNSEVKLQQIRTNYALTPSTGVTVNMSDAHVQSDLIITVTAATPVGAASTLELSSPNEDKDIVYALTDESFSNLLLDSTSTMADISVEAHPSSTSMTISLSLGAWRSIPRVGDMIRIPADSPAAGPFKENKGDYIVTSASAKTLVLSSENGPLANVAPTPLAGQNNALMSALTFASSDVAFRRIDSEQERKVRINALQVENGTQTAPLDIGGNICFEMGYYNPLATSAKATITTKRELIITPVGTGLTPIRILLNKYNSLESLATFMNANPYLSARVLNAQDKSRSTRVLDAIQDVDCLQPNAIDSYPTRIKRDYSDWLQYFADNTNLIAFKAGSMLNKAGLPSADPAPLFLEGAILGSTNMASIQAALDAAKKIVCRIVVPLFSRDSVGDIMDGLTDENSAYSIDAINLSARTHVNDMSAPTARKYRHAQLSYHGSFEATKEHVGMIAHERCQMSFMLSNALDAEGNNSKALPFIEACAVAAARCQARLGTALLRKPFNLSSAEHYGDVSLYSSFDEMTPDFDSEDDIQLSEAIIAGLLVFKEVPGFGVRMESPDLSTRSRINDPQAWVWERSYVLFTCDEVRETVESVLDPYIGDFEQPVSVIRTAISDTVRTGFMEGAQPSVTAFKIISLERVGVGYKAKVAIKPAECTEYFDIVVEASRNID